MGLHLQDEHKAAQAVTYGPKKLACQGTKHETYTKQEESSKSIAYFTISFKALMTCWELLSNRYVFHEQVYCKKLFHNFVTGNS